MHLSNQAISGARNVRFMTGLYRTVMPVIYTVKFIVNVRSTNTDIVSDINPLSTMTSNGSLAHDDPPAWNLWVPYTGGSQSKNMAGTHGRFLSNLPPHPPTCPKAGESRASGRTA